MRKRDQIIQKFSTFLRFETRNNFPSFYWQESSKLKKNMEKMVTLNPNADESFFVEHWLEEISLGNPLGNPLDNLLARLHLSAYLEEACYYAAFNCVTQYADEYPSRFEDFFEIARLVAATPHTLLENYNPHLSSIGTYAQLKLRSVILEYIGRDRDLNKYSDWGLLRKQTKKSLKKALQNAGINEPYLYRYLLVWEAFQQIYSPIATRANFQLPPPTSKQWAGMAAYYNERLIPRHQEEAVSSSDIQNWLKVCLKAVRESTKVEYYSIDVYNPTLELSIARKSQEQHIYSDEQVGVSEQWQQLKTVLTEALAGLPNEEQKMLLLEYGVELTQIEIAKMFGFNKQYQVSRHLNRCKRPLLKALADWSKRHAQINLSVEKINDLSLCLDKWLSWYYQKILIDKLQQTGFFQNLKDEMPILYHYYRRKLPFEEVTLQLKISESDIDEKLAKEKQYLQVILQSWVQNTLEVPTNYVNSVAKSIATWVKRFLPNAPSSIFKNEQR